MLRLPGARARGRRERLAVVFFGFEDALDRVDSCRQPDGFAFDIGNEPGRYEMMMPFVGTGPAAVAGQLDAVTLNPVNFAEGCSFGIDNLHMFAHVFQIAHPQLL